MIREYRDLFGADNFFLELVSHPEAPSQTEVNALLVELGRKTQTPVVGTGDVHYLRDEDREAQDALLCIHDGKLLSDANRASVAFMDLSLKAPLEMVAEFRETPEAVENARRIADRCRVKLELGKNLLPTFDVPDGETPIAFLRRLCEDKIASRYPDPETLARARERMAFELDTIERMGFASYFLIVQDYIVWAKERGVIVGPGRGSAAGSVVSYALRITDLDPLRYGLLFERFLNPDRISMPDIDTDFDDVRRKDVIAYVTEKYGASRVAGIITFGTMAARAAVRDTGRALGMAYADVDRVAKVIPPPVQGKHIPLKISVKNAPELKQMYESDPRVKRLVDLAIKLEGTARHASQHACGIVIAPEALEKFAPLQKAQGGDVEQVIQYSLHPSEAVGLLKMDFLGLSNLSIIRDCLEITEAVHGVTVDMSAIPQDDPPTFAMLGRGETTGVFQLESEGMKKHIRELRPTVIDDIIAMVALYRPGPMQFIESFIARKHGKEKITYAHPLAENALKSTYGLPIYQEQVMQVAKDMAGFTGGQADTLRKAMGKKIAKLMAEMKVKFVEGSVKNGVPDQTAEAIFRQFEEFAAYGFNKSHAACYAVIAYQTAYLKAHYPECFMAALLNSDCANLDRITIEVEECRRMGMEALPPDINESFTRFSVVKGTNKLRFGLLAIKGLGEDVVESIIRERKANGAYATLGNFLSRVSAKAFNRKSLDALIRSGALDRYAERNTLFYNMETILEEHRRTQQETSSGQFNLFGGNVGPSQSALRLKPAPPATQPEMLAWEKELLGLYVSAHPFKEYGERLGHLLVPIAELAQHKNEKNVRIGGIVTSAKKIFTKNNEPMAFAIVADTSGDVEAVVFPRVYRDKPELWEADRVVALSGRAQEKDGEIKFLVDTGFELTPENIEEVIGDQMTGVKGCEQRSGDSDQGGVDHGSRITDHGPAITLYLRAHLPRTILHKLRYLFDQHPGDYPVYFEVDNADKRQKILSSHRVAFDVSVEKELEAILGADTVRMEW